MTELPKTEAELQALLDAKANEVTESLTAQHNGQMANMRKKYESDLQKAKEQATMSAEQIAEQKIKEQHEAEHQELEELRAFKKTSLLSERLKKENLPDYFKNDNRLLTADDGNLDKVIKTIKNEYEASQPKGATHSTVVQSNNGKQAQVDTKTQLFEEVGDALKQALGK